MEYVFIALLCVAVLSFIAHCTLLVCLNSSSVLSVVTVCHWWYHHYCYSFVTKISAMGPYEEGEAIESISFMKESDKYSLHQILWDNEDHLSNAIIAMRLVVFQILVLE